VLGCHASGGSLCKIIEVPPEFSARRDGVIRSRLTALQRWSRDAPVTDMGAFQHGVEPAGFGQFRLRLCISECNVSAASTLSDPLHRPDYLIKAERHPDFDPLQVWREPLRTVRSPGQMLRPHHRAIVRSAVLELGWNAAVAHCSTTGMH